VILLNHSEGIPCAGQQVYALRHRTAWLSKIAEAGVLRPVYHGEHGIRTLKELARSTWRSREI